MEIFTAFYVYHWYQGYTDMLVTGVNDAADKWSQVSLLLLTNLLCLDKFITSVVDTDDYALSQIFIDSLTTAIYFKPVTSTTAIIYCQCQRRWNSSNSFRLPTPQSKKTLYECKMQHTSISTKYKKTSSQNCFLIYRQCNGHRWLTITFD